MNKQIFRTKHSLWLITLLLWLPACLGAIQQTAQQDHVLAVSKLTVEHMKNPLGIDAAQPRFGWLLTANYNYANQTAYEIRVSSDAANSGNVWSSGKVSSRESFDVVCTGAPLQSNTRYYWSVRVWDGDRSSPWSEPAWFETAFLDASQFKGEWIGRVRERQQKETPEALLRKEFELSVKPIRTARLYVSGLGYFKAYINGKRVDTAELEPGYTPFDKRILYVTYDVTALLSSGSNAVGVSLGRGFYADYNDIDTSVAPWLSEPKLKLQLAVTYDDGTTQNIVSDRSWKSSDGPTLTNSVKYGETYDARRQQPGWNDLGFDDARWQSAVPADVPTGVLQARNFEPVRVVGELPPPVATHVNDAVTLYDFRATRAGWAKVTLKGAAGSQVKIAYGEKLKADGTVNLGNDGPFGGTAVQCYTYTLRGDTNGESYTPSYSYDGYRFVQIEAPENVTVTSVTGLILNNDVARTGTFDCSDPLLNRYHQAMVTSLLSNMHNIPTDTPMYEKRGWTADALLMVDSALMNFDSENFWENWMLDHKYNQAADGGLAEIVPNENPGGEQEDPFVGSTGDPIWSSSYVLVNYALYRQRGDTRTLQDNYTGMKKWMAKWMDTLAGTGYVFDGTTWGDHEPAYGGGSNNYLVGTAFVYRSARALAEIADVVGQPADAQTFNQFADRVHQALNDEYYDAQAGNYDFPYKAQTFGGAPAGNDTGGPSAGGAPGGAPGSSPEDGAPGGAAPAADGPASAAPQADAAPAGGLGGGPAMSAAEVNAKQFQTDNVLPLALHLVPDADREALCRQLLDDVDVTNDKHITTGATVLKDVMPMLTECGGAEIAYEAATNPTFPGWGYWFVGLDGTRGAGGETIITDTFWEAWYDSARSHNHAFRGTIDDWLYQYLAGIKATKPGYRAIRIKPYPVGDLTHAQASINTPLGEVSSGWRRDGSSFELNVQVPVGATAEVFVPVGSGAQVIQQGGAEFVGISDGYAEYKVSSGVYRFVAQ